MRDLVRLVVVGPEAQVALHAVDLIRLAVDLEAVTNTAETIADHVAP